MLVACPHDGCGTTPKVLASGLDTNGRYLVTDETYLYFAFGNANRGGITRIGK